MENSGYCLKCKDKKEIVNGTVKTNVKGNKYINGNCKDCNKKINRILKKDIKFNFELANDEIKEN
jgi:hypothetical protein